MAQKRGDDYVDVRQHDTGGVAAIEDDDARDDEVNYAEIMIPKESYTAMRLYNTVPEVIANESKVTIIGPVPIDWLRRNRDMWSKKRYRMARKLLPKTPAHILGNKLAKRRRSEVESVHRINKELMDLLELSPSSSINSELSDMTTTLSPGALPNTDRSGTLIDTLERQNQNEMEHEDSTAGISGTGAAMSSLAMAHPVAIDPTVRLYGGDDAGETAQGTRASETPQRPVLQTQGTQETGLDSFVTAFQTIASGEDAGTVQSGDDAIPEIVVDEAEGEEEEVESGDDDDDHEELHVISGNEASEEMRVDDSADIENGYLSEDGSYLTTTSGSANSQVSPTGLQQKRSFSSRHSSPARVSLRSKTSEHHQNKRHREKIQRMVRFPVDMVEDAMEAGERKAGRAADEVHRNYEKIKSKSRKKMASARKVMRRKKRGEVVRLERMLVMVKHYASDDMPKNFNEAETVDTRLVERWKEYVVVARNTGDEAAPVLLQFYQSRNIAKIESDLKQPKSKLDLLLSHSDIHVNFYSTLDKTVVLWTPDHVRGKGTLIYILHSRTRYSALQWLALFDSIIGVQRNDTVQLHVPDLGMSIDVPFPTKERLQLLKAEPQVDVKYSELISYNASPSRLVTYVLSKSLERLRQIDSVRQYIDREWVGKTKVGLAWRRYDHLEWVFDLREQYLQAAWAMKGLFDLELRAKTTYTRSVTLEDGNEMDEPTPVEGFLTRLSSWTGQQHSNKLFFKKIYLHTHDNLLFWCQAMKSLPPRPDGTGAANVNDEEDIEELAANAPIVYDVSPYALNEVTGQISWISGDTEEFKERNQLALFEMQRRVASIQRSEGFINLCEVHSVQAVDDTTGSASTETDWADLESQESSSDLLEIVLETGLILRLKTHNRVTRDEWVRSLNDLMRYWKRRLTVDTQRSHAIRQKNLSVLQIDDDMEAFVSESASKWETTGGIADPLAYTVSGHSWSRSIHMKGYLFQKPSKFSSFRKYYAVLCCGSMILYTPHGRDHKGTVLPRIAFQKYQTVSLAECYVYSGTVTSTDLMNRDRWFDKNNPGKHALPRVYSDGWKSAEEESMRCFVLWFGRKRVKAIKTFKNDKAKEKKGSGRLRMVNRLGVQGIAMVFIARSRQERDAWVDALSLEIGRAAEGQDEDIQIV